MSGESVSAAEGQGAGDGCISRREPQLIALVPPQILRGGNDKEVKCVGLDFVSQKTS